MLGKVLSFCSMKHLKERDVIDPTMNEVAAALAGGRQGGEYLEGIGKTDLAALSAPEWQQFLLCVIGGYTEQLAEDSIPF
jgi:hypothetical protein